MPTMPITYERNVEPFVTGHFVFLGNLLGAVHVLVRFSWFSEVPPVCRRLFVDTCLRSNEHHKASKPL